MKHTTMGEYLDALILASEDGVAKLQLQMKPGITTIAGGVRHAKLPDGKPAHGLYEMCTVGKMGDPTHPGADVLVSQIFRSSEVSSISRMMEVPEEMKPSGLVIPSGSGKLSGPGGFPSA